MFKIFFCLGLIKKKIIIITGHFVRKLLFLCIHNRELFRDDLGIHLIY